MRTWIGPRFIRLSNRVYMIYIEIKFTILTKDVKNKMGHWKQIGYAVRN